MEAHKPDVQISEIEGQQIIIKRNKGVIEKEDDEAPEQRFE